MHACRLPTVTLAAAAAAAALQDSLSCTLRFFAACQFQRALSAPHFFDNELPRSSLLQESIDAALLLKADNLVLLLSVPGCSL
jgi:hypothetical protein